MSTLLPISWHKRATIATVLLAKTPLITALGAYNSKTARWNCFILLFKHGRTRLLVGRDFWQSLKNSVGGVQSRLNFSKIWGGYKPDVKVASSSECKNHTLFISKMA